MPLEEPVARVVGALDGGFVGRLVLRRRLGGLARRARRRRLGRVLRLGGFVGAGHAAEQGEGNGRGKSGAPQTSCFLLHRSSGGEGNFGKGLNSPRRSERPRRTPVTGYRGGGGKLSGEDGLRVSAHPRFRDARARDAFRPDGDKASAEDAEIAESAEEERRVRREQLALPPSQRAASSALSPISRTDRSAVAPEDRVPARFELYRGMVPHRPFRRWRM